jgi:hypothetical protein
MNFKCPVCFYPDLPYPPADYNICPCCGTEFGSDDAHLTHRQLRRAWVAGGAHWFFGRAAEGWNPWFQLIQSEAWELLPSVNTRFEGLETMTVAPDQDLKPDWRLVPTAA